MERLDLNNLEELRSIATVLPDSYKVVIGYKESYYSIFAVEQDIDVETGRDSLFVLSWDGSLQMGVRTFVGLLYSKHGSDKLIAMPAEDINENLKNQLTEKQHIVAAEIDVESELLVLWTGEQEEAEKDPYLRVSLQDASKLLAYTEKGDIIHFRLPDSYGDVFGMYIQKLLGEPYGTFVAGRIGGGNIYAKELQCDYDITCYLPAYIKDLGYDADCVLRLSVTPELLQARVRQILAEGDLLIE